MIDSDVGGALARKAPKMTNLLIEETSGVDHPAHLHEGWLVIKASDTTTVAEALKTLPDPMEASMSEATVAVDEQKAEDMPEQEKGMYEDEEMKQEEEALAVAEARIAELEARIAELEAMMETEPEEPMEGEEEMEESVVALAKSAAPEVRKAIAEMAKAKAQAEAALVKEREDRADEAAIAKAREQFSHLNLQAEKVGPALRRLAVMDAELAKSVEDALLSADAQNESADIFTEVGKGYALKGDAIEKMTSLAKAAVAEGKATTIEQALAQVAVENPALYNDYLIEKGA
jgi:vacuolar-type H+-ATPase subunit I/STV1